MFELSKKKIIFFSLVYAFTLTGFSYIYLYVRTGNFNFRTIINSFEIPWTILLAKDAVVPERLLIVFFWTLAGIFVYLLYLSMSRLYYSIYNEIVSKVSFKAGDLVGSESPKVRIRRAKRVFIHLGVIFYHLLLLALSIFVIIPAALRVHALTQSVIRLQFALSFVLSWSTSFFFCLLSIIPLMFLDNWLRTVLQEEDLKEEHLPEEVVE